MVAVIVHDVMDEYFSEIARGIEDEAYANGYVTLICNTDRDPDKEVHYLRKLRAMQVDAILFTAGGVRDPAIAPRSTASSPRSRRRAGSSSASRLTRAGGPTSATRTVGFRSPSTTSSSSVTATIGFLAGPPGIPRPPIA